MTSQLSVEFKGLCGILKVDRLELNRKLLGLNMVFKNPKVMVIYGTRPEAIKLAPVIRRLKSYDDIDVAVVSTGQHEELLAPIVERFGIQADHQLPPMPAGRALNTLLSATINGIDSIYAAAEPDVVLVQGDTTTAFAAALAAFNRGVSVTHLEAGLRTGDIRAPFPEEANRRLISQITDLHCAPSADAAQNLLSEGVSKERVVITGNTVIDALHEVAEWHPEFEDPRIQDLIEGQSRFVLVTAHRRENLDKLGQIASAIEELAGSFPDVQFVIPLHANPRVKGAFEESLAETSNVLLIEALPYAEFTALLRHSWLVITDSGGVQEEAPALGIPVLLMREKTERHEVLQTGAVRLVGTDTERIVDAVSRLLNNDEERKAMAIVSSPYGEGRASYRVADALHDLLLNNC